MATQAKVFPIYEVQKWHFSKKEQRFVEKWEYRINVYPEKEVPVMEYLKSQGRFRLMTDDMYKNLQERVDRKWNDLVNMAGYCRHDS